MPSTRRPHPERSTARNDRSGFGATAARSGSGSRRNPTASHPAAAAVRPGTTRQPARSATRPAPTLASAMPVADAVRISEIGRWRVAAGHTSPT